MRIRVNGIELFYETSGKGPPIILLHGNGEDHTIFDVLTKKLSANYTVYGVDSRGHGKSGKVKTLDYQSMMEDTAAFIRALDIKSPVLYGFSDGGIIGLLLAVRYPDLLSTLIVSGANTHPGGIRRRYALLMKIVYFFTRSPKYKLMLTQPDISRDDLAKIMMPTLVLAGSRDLVRDAHTRMLAARISNSRLRILNGESHASYVVHSKKLYEIIRPFLLHGE